MLAGFLPLLRYELTHYRVTPGTWLFLALGSMACALATFYLGHVFTNNTASMVPLFKYIPWIFLFFGPSLVMGAWASEWRYRTIERLLTLPVTPLSITLAKFTAAWLLLGLFLILTLPMLATLMYLGEPDIGPVVSSYIGSFLVGGAFISVGLFASVLSRSQAGGYSLGFVMLLMLISVGWGVVTSMLENVVPVWVIHALHWGSVLDRFYDFVMGFVDVRNVVFFLSLTGLFLALSHAVLYLKLGQPKRLVLMPAALVGFLLVNVALSPFYVQFDLTEEKLHTFSYNTEETLETLSEPVEATLYFSRDNVNISPKLHRYAMRVYEMLKLMKDVAPSHLNVNLVVPENSIDDELDALRFGVEERPLKSGEGFYMGLVFKNKDIHTTLPFLDPARHAFLEYDLVRALHALDEEDRGKILLMTGIDLRQREGVPSFLSELSRLYEVEIAPENLSRVADDVDMVLVYAHPFIHKENVYALDQYIVRGGKALVFLDPFIRTAQSEQFLLPDRNADELSVDHPADLLRRWGVNYDYKKVVADSTRAMPVELETAGTLQYPLWMSLDADQINQELPFSSGTERLLMIESGYFDVRELAKGLTLETIVSSGPQAQFVERDLLAKADIKVVSSNLRGEGQARNMALMLSGTFPSAYENHPLWLKHRKAEHRRQTEEEGAVIYFADSDFLANDYALTTENYQGRDYVRPANDNLALGLNAVDYLMGDVGLMALRAKKEKARPFTRVANLMHSAAMHYRNLEDRLMQELEQVAEGVSELNTMDVSDQEVRLQRRAYREKELETRKQLRQVRREARAHVETLGRVLAALNILGVPLLLLGASTLLFMLRRRRY